MYGGWTECSNATKIWPQNKDLRFPIHKIDQTEKSPPKNKICHKNKDLRFPPTKKIAVPNENLPLKYS